MSTFTNPSKNSISPAIIGKPGRVAWDDASYAWDSSVALWNSPIATVYAEASKNSISPTNLSKS